jgi:hypothetical protein
MEYPKFMHQADGDSVLVNSAEEQAALGPEFFELKRDALEVAAAAKNKPANKKKAE